MSDIRWEHYPVLAQSPQARTWLTIQANLGLALNTIEAYGRALEDFLVFSSRRAVSPEVANREHISLYVHDLTSRPNPGGTKVRVLDSGAGLANATLQDTAGEPRLYARLHMEKTLKSRSNEGFASSIFATASDCNSLILRLLDGRGSSFR